MTAEEKKAYNNGFILGMASKGVIKTKGEDTGLEGKRLILFGTPNKREAREVRYIQWQ